MQQFHLGVVLHRLHEGVGDTDRDVEVLQVAHVLGVDEGLHVRVVAAQHAHLGAAPGAGGFHRLAGAVEHPHVGHRPAGPGLGALHQGALGPDGGEVVAHAAAPAHGLGRFLQGGVDAGFAVRLAGDGVPHRLDEAVDQGGLELGAGGGVDAPARDEAVLHGVEEAFLPGRPLPLFLDGSQCPGHPQTHVGDGLFVTLGVFLQQDLAGDGLVGEFGE